nr:MAG TPA: hypothetical protein [Caudoviricetes sp.]DAX48312.1 MAG TPA: hypothetical protein [Caudoviricetes sp.]
MMDIHYVSIYHRTFNFYISIEKQQTNLEEYSHV